MNTRDVILVGAGVVVGYLLVGYMKKSKDKSGSTDEIVTTPILPAVDQATIDACNKEADDYMATVRPSAGTDLVALRKEKFDACIASKNK
jgi:predicted phosphoribosyltransferase